MSSTTPSRARRRRAVLATTALILTLLALLATRFAERALASGPGPDLGVLTLRLAYNPGVAFGLGAALPTGTVTVLTALVGLVIAVYAWRTAPSTPFLGRIGLAAVLAGALANLIDRAGDGVVTDYLHIGWFPTFNTADVLITVGVALLFLAQLRAPAAATATGPQ